VPLPAAEHALVLRQTKQARNLRARLRRLEERAQRLRPAAALRLTLPGVVSWQRPREQPLKNGGRRTAYPPTYEAGRTVWSLYVRGAVAEAGWAPPDVRWPLAVEAEVVAGGKFDLDRVTTALLDALQAGGAIKDDCRVFRLSVRRRPLEPDEGRLPRVNVAVGVLDGI
jgi:hypothetical protein